MNRVRDLAYARYSYLLGLIPKNWTKEKKASAVRTLLEEECIRCVELMDEVKKQKEVIARGNAMIMAERENRKAPKCKAKPTSMRSPAVIKRSIKAALAR